MGIRRASVIGLSFVFFLLAVSIVAEDPVPAAQLKSERPAADTLAPSSQVSFDAPTIVLAAYPIRDDRTAPAVDVATVPAALETLRAAAAANDYPLFHAALVRAKELIEAMPLGDARNTARGALLVYRDVEQVWQFSATDRLGAFYDDESLPGFHDRIAADYAGYDAFIADYRVVDRSGRALYGTAETRAFLLRQVQPVTQPKQQQPVIAHKATATHATHIARAKAPSPGAARHPLPLTQERGTIAEDALVADMHNAAIVTAPLPAPAPVATLASVEPVTVHQGNDGRGLVFFLFTLTGIGVVTMMMRPQRVA